MLALPALLLPLGPARAAVYTVGQDGCTCSTIQCAFDYAELGGPHTVRITRSLVYTAQNATLTLDQGESVIIEGGYANCAQAVADATNTVISGSGGSTDSVLEFVLGPSASVQLRRLEVRDGDDTGGYGGGISQVGGSLRIDNSNIRNNAAMVGGGIYTEAGILEIGSNVLVQVNEATLGGGIALSNAELFMNDAGSLIFLNHADGGYGGGLYIGPGSNAELGAPANPSIGLVYGNTAAHGGGVAVVADADPSLQIARLEMHSVDPANPAGIIANAATVRGGGIYMRPACCWNGGDAPAFADFNNGATIRENVAPEGAAVYLDKAPGEDVSADMKMIDGEIAFNLSLTPGDSSPTNGSIIYHAVDDPDLGSHFRLLTLTRTRLRFNEGGHLVRSGGYLRVEGSLLSDNIARLSLVRSVGSTGIFSLLGSTVAGNTITPSSVLETSNDFYMVKSILHQPGKTSLLRTGGSREVEYVVASETASLVDLPGGTVIPADPQLWDPGSGNYRLHAASPAVDFAPEDGGEDLDGNPGSVNLPLVGDHHGPDDLGAYERQEMLPLVRNNTFALLNLWQANGGQYVADSAQADGTGGVYVAATAPVNGRVIGPTQCVPLPSWGNYSLRGWGKEPSASMASADYPRLEWQLFLGSIQCSGAASSEGGIALPSGDNWGLSGQTFFSVPNDDALRPLASVLIWLVAVDNNASGSNLVDAYFDNIILEHDGNGNLAPTIVSPILNRTDTEGDFVTIETAPHFTDPDGDDLGFTATNLPEGITIDPLGGAIVGTLGASSAGVHAVLVTAKDPFGASVAQAFSWTVEDLPNTGALFKDGFEGN